MRKLTVEEEKQGYHLDKWKQHPNFNCNKCQYSTIDKVKMQKHLASGNKHKHIWAFPPEEGSQEV